MVDALAITGATATGKTALAIDVALALNGEIISLDSRQVYRGMDIGTAKPSAEQRARVRHHGLDLIDPSERYSAGRFASDARRWITDIQDRGKVAVLVGGTGFFLRALTHPIFAEPALPGAQRRALDAFFASQETEDLLRWLEQLDPTSATRLARQGGRQRMTRALEIALLSGRPLTWWHTHAPPTPNPLNVLTFVLDLPRAELNRRIDTRVHAMIAAGLVGEVHDLMQHGHDAHAPGMNATGYIELIPHVRGEVELAAAIAEIQRTTRGYARRQQTWFRHQLPAGAEWLDAGMDVGDLRQIIVSRWEREVCSEDRN